MEKSCGSWLTYRRTFYFPTVGEYAPMLERHGLQVRAALLFDRPTPQQTEDGSGGLDTHV